MHHLEKKEQKVGQNLDKKAVYLAVWTNHSNVRKPLGFSLRVLNNFSEMRVCINLFTLEGNSVE